MTDLSKGFGGKYGVQKDRQDDSAVGWEYQPKAEKHASQRYIVENAPWELAKAPEGRERLNGVIYNLLEVMRMIALPLQPVMPDTAALMFKVLGVDGELSFESMGDWGGHLVVGTEMSHCEALFPRLDKKKDCDADKGQAPAKKKAGKESKKAESSASDGLVEFADFFLFSKLLECVNINAMVFNPVNVLESELRHTPVKRHLTTFKSGITAVTRS